MLSSTPRVYRFLGLELDVIAGELRDGDRNVTLSRQQLAMLRTLASAHGKTVSRELLLREVWNGTVVSEGALRQAIWDLRKLLGCDGSRAIEAVRGRGYRLSAAITALPEAGSNTLPRPADSARLRGRDRELRELERALSDALERAGRACVLIGPAGAGKSRLAREIVERAALDGTEHSESYTERDDTLPPLWPWTRLLESCLHDAAEPLRARCKTAFPDLFAWLELEGDSARAWSLHEPSERRLRLFDQLSRAFALLLKDQPRVCLIEDVQWADAASLAFLAHHARVLTQTKTLWLFTCRSTDDAASADLARALCALDQGPHNRRVLLAALSRSDVADVLSTELEKAAPESLVADVHALTGGNALLVVELARALNEGTACPKLDAEALKPIVEQRLRRSSVAALGVLQVAAILARDFTIVELAALLERPENEVADCIDECRQSGILIELGDHRFTFARPLLQRCAYALLGYRERCRLHGRVASRLESLASVERSRRLSELVHHFYQSGERAHLRKALEYARKAGETALAAAAYGGAVEHFQSALRCAELLADCGPSERIALELSRVEAMHAEQGSSEPIRAAYRALADRARDAAQWSLYARATSDYMAIRTTDGWRS